jgi:hypothetical protein
VHRQLGQSLRPGQAGGVIGGAAGMPGQSRGNDEILGVDLDDACRLEHSYIDGNVAVEDARLRTRSDGQVVVRRHHGARQPKDIVFRGGSLGLGEGLRMSTLGTALCMVAARCKREISHIIVLNGVRTCRQ